MDHENYTVKEMIQLVVIPSLEELKRSVADKNEDNEERFRSLESSRNRILGAIAFIVAVLVPLAVPVVITVLNGTH